MDPVDECVVDGTRNGKGSTVSNRDGVGIIFANFLMISINIIL